MQLQAILRPMVATREQILDMEAFFKSGELPKEFVLRKAITFTNLPKFIAQVINNLKADQVNDVVNRPRWDDLVEIRKVLEKT
jgi:hypothetical protein